MEQSTNQAKGRFPIAGLLGSSHFTSQSVYVRLVQANMEVVVLRIPAAGKKTWWQAVGFRANSFDQCAMT